MTLNEKASYIKGLVEGFGLDKESKEGKAILEIVDLLKDMAESISELENGVDDATDQLEDISDEVDEIHDRICDCHGGHGHQGRNKEHRHEENGGVFYEIDCPACNTTVCLSEDTLESSDGVCCPNCGQNIDLELDDSDECVCSDCDCGCSETDSDSDTDLDSDSDDSEQ